MAVRIRGGQRRGRRPARLSASPVRTRPRHTGTASRDTDSRYRQRRSDRRRIRQHSPARGVPRGRSGDLAGPPLQPWTTPAAELDVDVVEVAEPPPGRSSPWHWPARFGRAGPALGRSLGGAPSVQVPSAAWSSARESHECGDWPTSALSVTRTTVADRLSLINNFRFSALAWRETCRGWEPMVELTAH